MTLEKVYTMLQTTGLPVVFYEYKEPTGGVDKPEPVENYDIIPDPPYIVYLISDQNDIYADNVVVFSNPTIRVELYTEVKDPDSEKIVEDMFLNNRITYEKSEVAVDDEGLYMAAYEFDILEVKP